MTQHSTMNDDELISFMWRSIVPTVVADGGEQARDLELLPVDYCNPHDHEMQVKEDPTTYYAEPAAQDHLVQVYDEEYYVEPINQWNEAQQMMVQDYPAAVPPAAPAAAANSELVYYVADAGVEPIDYDWNQYVMANGYTEAGGVKDIPADVVVGEVKKLSIANDQSQAAKDDDRHRKVKIFKVPKSMGNAEKDSYYAPQVVSIGPYHFNLPPRDHLDETDELKWKCTNVIWSEPHTSMKRCIAKVKKIAEDVKRCYESQENLHEWKPVEMVLDACFILVGFRILPPLPKYMPRPRRPMRRLERPETQGRTDLEKELSLDEEFGAPVPMWMLPEAPQIMPPVDIPFDINGPSFTHDIFLLENQMPFRIIEIVYDTTVDEYKKKIPWSLRRQVAEFLNKVLILYPTAVDMKMVARSEKIGDIVDNFDHILDYCHKYFAPSKVIFASPTGVHEEEVKDKLDTFETLNKWHRATELRKVGVMFENTEGKNSRQSLLDICFKHGVTPLSWLFSRRVLEIPRLVIDSQTYSLFRNIIAFEQQLSRCTSSDFSKEQLGRHAWSKNYMTAYVKFMGNLMTTSDDVSLLARKGIIVNHLGDDNKVAELFRDLMKGVTIKFEEDNYLVFTYSELHDYYTSSFNKTIAELKQTYFRTIWVCLATVVGMILTACAVIGAVYNIKK